MKERGILPNFTSSKVTHQHARTVCAGARVRGHGLAFALCCKMVPELLHVLYSGMLLRELKGQVQLVKVGNT